MHTMTTKTPGETRREIRRRLKDDQTYEQIEDALDVHPSTISDVAAEAGLKGRRGKNQCPSCTAFWDGERCNACGHEPEDPPAQRTETASGEDGNDEPSRDPSGETDPSAAGNGVDDFMPSNPEKSDENGGSETGDETDPSGDPLEDVVGQRLQCPTCEAVFEVEEEDLSEIRENKRLDCPRDGCPRWWRVDP